MRRILAALIPLTTLLACAPDCPPPQEAPTAPPAAATPAPPDFGRMGFTPFQENILQAVDQTLILPVLPAGFVVSNLALSERIGGPGSGPSLEIAYNNGGEKSFDIGCASTGLGSLPAPTDPTQIKKVNVDNVGEFELLPVEGQIALYLNMPAENAKEMTCTLSSTSMDLNEMTALVEALKKAG